MAHLNDVSAGNYTKMFYNSGSAFTEITEVQSIGSPTDEATVIQVPQYGVQYQRSIVGSKTAGSIELVLNWNPSNPTHQAMVDKYATSERVDFYIEYTTPAGTESTFRSFSGFVSSNSLGSEFDTVRTMTVSITIDGALGDFEDTAPVAA
ncbi:hypothetical protein HJ059_18650 [Vibrio parahaemolyticus]|nr:hypothetical protein [Vibrio parahaemolyticus]MDF4994577.1 phage tail tube protein [Vibrio parahaemolyticus]HCG5955132.1 hypothetical protein [Vibrio parahaemolyticus]HCH1607398.1 hypothetical protein [Vibrio parahaemolyticus]HCM0850415.1 hypothetical protein [Vibrio parahaemolyticus]